jgi:hypothetical protein
LKERERNIGESKIKMNDMEKEGHKCGEKRNTIKGKTGKLKGEAKERKI